MLGALGALQWSRRLRWLPGAALVATVTGFVACGGSAGSQGSDRSSEPGAAGGNVTTGGGTSSRAGDTGAGGANGGGGLTGHGAAGVNAGGSVTKPVPDAGTPGVGGAMNGDSGGALGGSSGDGPDASGPDTGPCTCPLPTYQSSVAVPANYTYVETFAIGADGTAYLAGTFSGRLDFDPGPGMDVHDGGNQGLTFLTKFDGGGKYAWTRVLGPELVAGLALAPGNAVVVTGRFSETVDFDPGAAVDSHTAIGSWEPFVMKILSDGSFGWARTLRTSPDGDGEVMSCSIGPNGEVLIEGDHVGTIDLDPGPGSRSLPDSEASTFVVMFTASGDFAWGSGLFEAGCDGLVRSLAVDPDGTARLAGYFSTPCFGPTGGGTVTPVSMEGYIASFAPGGAFGGLRRLGGLTSVVRPTSLAIASDGTLMLAGSFDGKLDFDPGPGKVEREATSMTTGFVVASKPDGTFAWVQTLGQDSLYAIALDPGGGVIALAKPNDNKIDSHRILAVRSDGISAWTLDLSGVTALSAISSDATRFAVLGFLNAPTDVDPGPQADVIGQTDTRSVFVSRYVF